MGRFKMINEIIRFHAANSFQRQIDVPVVPLGVDKAENMRSTGIKVNRQGTIKQKLLKGSNPSRYIEQADSGSGIYNGNPIKLENFPKEGYLGEVL